MRKDGFTLIEVLLALALITILLGFSAPMYQAFQTKQHLLSAAEMTAQALRRAQALAEASDGDASWGVSTASGNVVLYQGASYAARDASYDETYELPDSVVASGLSEIVFTRFTGLPTTIGSMTFTSSSNESRSISINEQGIVSW